MYTKRSLSVALLCLPLFACGNADSFRETMGLNHKGPDEFQVFSRPPLTVPPEFNLEVPKQGAEYAIGAPADEQAKHIVMQGAPAPAPSAHAVSSTAVSKVSSSSLPNTADSQFLLNAGSNKADKNIRQVITNDNDNGVSPKTSAYLLGTSTSDPLVDPTKEADRLKQDKAQNKPPTAGETPVVPPQSKGILSDIF